MNYQHLYDNLIYSRQTLKRRKLRDGSLESHHIIPKCLGGTNDHTNLVLLTPKEHYVAHHLLSKLYSGRIKAKLTFAFMRMCYNNQNQTRRVTAAQFDRARKLIALNCSGSNSPGYGKPKTDQEKTHLSATHTGHLNGMYGRSPWNKGLTAATSEKIRQKGERAVIHYQLHGHPQTGAVRTIETRQKISAGLSGKPKSESHRQALSKVNMGKQLSTITKERMSASRKGKPCPEHTCPHCGKIGKGSAMFKWHFDKCSTLTRPTLQ